MEDCARQRAYSKATNTIKTLSALNKVELASSLADWTNEVFAISVVKDKL
jgi:hypothetical protein